MHVCLFDTTKAVEVSAEKGEVKGLEVSAEEPTANRKFSFKFKPCRGLAVFELSVE